MRQQREWLCVCGYALLVVESRQRAAVFYDGANAVGACPRCERDLARVHGRGLAAGEAHALLARARAGDQLTDSEQHALAAALGLETAVLDELLREVRARRSVVVADGQLHVLNGTPPA